MVEPQEDLILKMMSQIDGHKAEMAAINDGQSPYLADRAAQNVKKVANFQQEVLEEAKDIQMRVVQLRTKIEDCRGTETNFAGFLLGTVDSYVEAYDAQIVKMNAQLESDEKYWRDKVESFAQNKQQQATELMEALAEMQKKVASILFSGNQAANNPQPPMIARAKFQDLLVPVPVWGDPPPIDLPLIDLPRFSEAQCDSDVPFRWPTPQQLKQMKLTKPLKLTQIFTVGNKETGLTQIQLKFEGGIESPLIDSNGFNHFRKTFNIRDHDIKRVIALDGFYYIYQLKLQDSRGTMNVTNQYSRDGNEVGHDIPKNHVIAGIYGTTTFDGQLIDYAKISSLGFILMDTSSLKKN